MTSRRGFFGVLAGVATAAALPLARKAVEANGYTILRLPHDMQAGDHFEIVNLGDGRIIVLGDVVHVIKEGGSLTLDRTS